MNIEKLKECEDRFCEYYEKGFEDEKLAKTVKLFNTAKFHEMAKNSFALEKFSNIEQIIQDFFTILLKSPLISFYEGDILKSALKNFTMYEKDMLSIFLQDILYGDFPHNLENSFDDFVELLASKNLAKWHIVTLIPYYFSLNKNYFLKPSTTRNIIKYFEIENLKYNSKPSFEFYKAYTNNLLEMKNSVNPKLKDDNGRFTGFLRLSMEK
ncbi:hypothetical protein [Arcobacter vandammei]|uniref:hypothetical protein n=1 Tax=Arcobacter vandammei TaxID=2782243 RepID=UPI0018E05163|nr:hypothetical protein [Arcobacter vandammei]